MRKLSDSGFTLAESLVTMAVLGVTMGGLMIAGSMLFRVEGQTTGIGDATRMTISLLENIRSDPSQFQINFAPESVTDEEILKSSSLPLAYRLGSFGPADECPTCNLKFGYVIRPMANYGGLFRVVIRSYNVSENTSEDFHAIVTSN